MSNLNCVDQMIQCLQEARKDMEDAYSGKFKASATRSRKAFKDVADLCKQARKDVLAISKGEMEPNPCTMTHALLQNDCCDSAEEE